MMLFYIYFFLSSSEVNYAESSDGLTLIISGSGTVERKIIESNSYQKYTVITLGEEISSIGSDAFKNCISVKKITFPEYMDSFGTECFSGCKSLLDLDIPNGITKITNKLFFGCESLQRIGIPATVTSILATGFHNCFTLSFFDINTQNKNYCALQNSTILATKDKKIAVRGASISHLIIPQSIETLQKNFISYSKVSSIEFLERSNVLTLEKNIFFDSLVTSIVFPESLLYVEDEAFARSKLVNVTFLGNVSYISPKAFYNAANIKNVIIPKTSPAVLVEDGVIYTKDEKGLIFVPSTIKTLKIKTDLETITTTLITNSLQLTDVDVDKNNKNFSSYKGVLYNKNQSHLLAVPYNKENVTVAENCTKICTRAFYKTQVRRIKFDDNKVELFEVEAMDLITNLIEFEMPPNIKTIQNYCFYGTPIPGGKLVFGSKLETLENSAFQNNPNLEILNMSQAKLISIANSAFLNNIKLTTVILPTNLKILDLNCFQSDPIASIVIPSQCTTIRGSAFFNSNISTIDFSNATSLTTIESNAFSGAPVKSIVFPDSLSQIQASSFSNCKKLTTIIFGSNSGLETLASAAFEGCISIKNVTLPGKLTDLKPDAFGMCSSLIGIEINTTNTKYNSIDGAVYSKNNLTFLICPCGRRRFEIPPQVTAIGHKAFFMCANLERLDLHSVKESSLTAIGDMTFKGCTALANISLPSSLSSLTSSAFADCTALSKVVFGDSCRLESLGAQVFSGCERLASVHFGENSSLRTIEAGAFSGCSSLSIVLPSGLTTIGSSAFEGCRALSRIDIPASVDSIGASAFRNCANLGVVTYCGTTPFNDTKYSTVFTGCAAKWADVVPGYGIQMFCGIPAILRLDSQCQIPSHVFTASSSYTLSTQMCAVAFAAQGND